MPGQAGIRERPILFPTFFPRLFPDRYQPDEEYSLRPLPAIAFRRAAEDTFFKFTHAGEDQK